MSVRDDLDRCASLVREADPYELASSIAFAANRYAMDETSPETEAATALRDVFGTWAGTIEAYGSPRGDLASADEARDLIVAALVQWAEGRRPRT
jgi:hypothetical protein